MDALSDILDRVKLSSAIYFKSDFSAPWGMDVSQGPFAQFHIVTSGKCILNTEETSISLYTGDIVVFPIGTSHWLADSENSELFSGQEVVQSIWNGNSLFKGDNKSATLVCGHFEFDRSIDHPFLKELPKMILIRDEEKRRFNWLENICNLVIQEASCDEVGSEIIVKKLGEVLFVHALRAYMINQDHKEGFMAAVQDERIGRVLKAIHSSPEKEWQLTSLAHIAGMSRTGFSNLFKLLLGDTPLSYVTQWRVLKAKELLHETTKPVGEIAEEVGYQSEAAFCRVFKKRVFLTPLKYRKACVV